ncbi:periplasmic heavy metal sensor [Sinirhodobacter populi]|uniref:Periplasmic heavy metal sensor n=2 Tax=Paenirhodobacter populi TaxID=2306993 RepID=A0A443KAD7_9RHOB|nr:periplasmic heavy metal sensor [Sinirhodobacter populi]
MTDGSMGKSMKMLLIASLAVNVLVVGVAVGGYLGLDRQSPPRPPQPPDMALGPLGSAFSREDRAAMMREAEKAGADLGMMRDSLRQDMQALLAALTAEPWDPDRVQRSLAEMRVRTERRAELGEKVMIDRLSAMSPDERQAYAAKLRARFDRLLSRAPSPGQGD